MRRAISAAEVVEETYATRSLPGPTAHVSYARAAVAGVFKGGKGQGPIHLGNEPVAAYPEEEKPLLSERAD